MSVTLRTSRATPLRGRIVALGVAVVALVLPASANASATGRVQPRSPITVTTSFGSVTFKSAPTRIISLSPTATQMLFSIGAGRDVIAADNDSTLPENAPRTSLSGVNPNVEAIAHYRPQLVVVSYNPNGLAAALHKLGIPVVELDAARSLRNTYAQLEELGRITGENARAQQVIATMRNQIAALVSSTPSAAKRLSYYYELDQTYYSVTSKTFIGSVMAMLGLRDIADAAPNAASGYPQLSAEYIVKSNPSLIVLADTLCCGQSPTTVAARPGWKSLAGVQHAGIVSLNDSIASQWGPNIVTLLRDVEAGLRRVSAHLKAP